MKKFLFAVLLSFAALSLGAADARACAVGDGAQVLWKGAWYPAHVLKAKDAECFIHYDGYDNSWDEWVGPDRIKVTSSGAPAPTAVAAFGEGNPVSVLWKGTWYPAHVLKALGGDRYRIHYDGYDSSWDENVGPSRIRSR